MPELSLNEYFIKLTGSAPLENGLELNKDYRIGAQISITNENKKHNEDGTYDHIFVGKLVRAVIQDRGTQTIKTKDVTKQSVKLRLAILRTKPDQKPDMEDDAYYELIMGGLRYFLPEFIEQILKENN